jgi:hypothetical protein
MGVNQVPAVAESIDFQRSSNASRPESDPALDLGALAVTPLDLERANAGADNSSRVDHQAPSIVADWEWTIELLSRGFDPESVVKIRRMTFSEFFEHLDRALSAQMLPDLSVLFTQLEETAIAEFISSDSPLKGNSASEALSSIPYEYFENAVRIVKKFQETSESML